MERIRVHGVLLEGHVVVRILNNDRPLLLVFGLRFCRSGFVFAQKWSEGLFMLLVSHLLVN